LNIEINLFNYFFRNRNKIEEVILKILLKIPMIYYQIMQ
jgi:hypothetical protein